MSAETDETLAAVLKELERVSVELERLYDKAINPHKYMQTPPPSYRDDVEREIGFQYARLTGIGARFATVLARQLRESTERSEAAAARAQGAADEDRKLSRERERNSEEREARGEKREEESRKLSKLTVWVASIATAATIVQAIVGAVTLWRHC